MTRITIKQIAEEAGVSMTTVSNVLNKKTHPNPDGEFFVRSFKIFYQKSA